MSDKVIGCVYYKLTDSKNLIGEFSNNYCKRNNFTESAVLDPKCEQKPEDPKFVGEYYTTWYDYTPWHEKHKIYEAGLFKLKIEQEHPCENIFCLTWRDISRKGKIGPIRFWGAGMLCDGILIAYFHNCADVINNCTDDKKKPA
jgi:hypothetical protein